MEQEQLEKPKSWANYWDAGPAYGDKIKGHLVAFEPANLLSVYALIMAAKLKGGGLDNMQPAWELLAAQKPWIGVSLLASDAAAPYFENDQVWLAPFWSARAGYYVGTNYPVDFHHPERGHHRAGQLLLRVPVGATNKKLAFEYIKFRLEPEIQRAFHLAYRTSPGRPDLGDWPAEYAATQIVTERSWQRRIPRQRADRQQARRMDSQVAGDHELVTRWARAGRPTRPLSPDRAARHVPAGVLRHPFRCAAVDERGAVEDTIPTGQLTLDNYTTLLSTGSTSTPSCAASSSASPRAPSSCCWPIRWRISWCARAVAGSIC